MHNEELKIVIDDWGEAVIDAINNVETIPMTFDEFLKKCTCCGGNWGGMLLTGVMELYPSVWDAIPDDMGWRPLTTIRSLLVLLGIER